MIGNNLTWVGLNQVGNIGELPSVAAVFSSKEQITLSTLPVGLQCNTIGFCGSSF